MTLGPVYVAGHKGLIGSAMLRRLEREGVPAITRTRAELELTDAASVQKFFQAEQPQYVVLAAGRVAGIVENRTYPADFLRQNLAIQMNVLQAAHESGVKKLLFFASSCMYPRICEQPMAETALLTGVPEPTSLSYAIAKLSGLQACLAYNQQYGAQRFIPVIPNSVFGPNDDFHPERGHVLGALMRRFHAAKRDGVDEVTLWGTGAPRREFIHADDVASACFALLTRDTDGLTLPLNIGTGTDISIKDLAETIAAIVGYTGRMTWDTSKPDGAPRKLLDSSRMHAFGWRPEITFETGLRATYNWFQEEHG